MAMGKKTNLFNQAFGTAVIAASASGSFLKGAWRKAIPERPKRAKLECQYCNELKREHDFIARGAIPYECQHHLSNAQRVCKRCMDLALRAQLDTKALIEVGCPQCGVTWDPEDVKMLVRLRTQKRVKAIDKLAREQALVPSDLPDDATIELLLEKAARFCPWCRWPFIKNGGCDSMLCTKCRRTFDIKYALILEDGSGRRAAAITRPESIDNFTPVDFSE